MSVQRPLAPLSIVVLGLVAERPMHPYEMVQTIIERAEDRLVRFRPGTLYHAVDRLAADGLIEVSEIRREGNRPERTVYALTASGRAALVASLEHILERSPIEYPELYLALSEAHALPRARVIELLELRVAAMTLECDRAVTESQAARAKGTPEMFFLDAGCRIVTLRAQVAWLSDLLTRLRSGQIEWLDDPDSRYAATKHLFAAEAATAGDATSPAAEKDATEKEESK